MYDTDKEWRQLNRDEAVVRWCCALAIAALLALFAWTCSLAVGAPAPAPRPAPGPVKVPCLLARHLAGEWALSWGGGTWDMTLARNGDYLATSKGGPDWTGRWTVDGDGLLYVSEAMIDDNGIRGCEMHWSVLWSRDWLGRHNATAPAGHVRGTDEGVAVKLVRRAPP